MPWPGVAWKLGQSAGWAVFAFGFLVAQEISVPLVQNNAAVGVAITGLVTLWIQYHYRDRSEARSSHVRDLEAKNAELTERVRDLERAARPPAPPSPVVIPGPPSPDLPPSSSGSEPTCPSDPNG